MEKVEIKIWDAGVFDTGEPYTSVRFSAKRYGASSPCTTEEEIQNSIKHFEKWIKTEGDKFFINDTRTKRKLLNWN